MASHPWYLASQPQLTPPLLCLAINPPVRAVVRAKCPPEDIIAACERQELNASVYAPCKEPETPAKDLGMSGYETPLSEVCVCVCVYARARTNITAAGDNAGGGTTTRNTPLKAAAAGNSNSTHLTLYPPLSHLAGPLLPRLPQRSTQPGMSEGGSDSPRYLTPPDLNACGDRVLVSMEDKTIGDLTSRVSCRARCACFPPHTSPYPPEPGYVCSILLRCWGELSMHTGTREPGSLQRPGG